MSHQQVIKIYFPAGESEISYLNKVQLNLSVQCQQPFQYTQSELLCS